MSLRVWLPLNGDLQNKGLSEIIQVAGTPTFKNNGKIGDKCLNLHTCNRFYCENLANKKEYSFTFWYKPETSSSTVNWNDVVLFYDTKQGSSTTGTLRMETSYGNNYMLSIHGNSSYNILPNTTGVGSAPLLNSNNTSRDIWYHIATTISEKDGIKCFVNGEQKWMVTPHQGGFLTGNFNLGQIATSGNQQGSMNDFRIYDHVLSLKEIKEISRGLVLHYPLDNNGLGKINPNLLRYPVSNSEWTLWGYGDALREKVILEDEKTWIHVKQQDTTRYDGYAINPDNNQIIIDNTKKYTISCLAKAGNKTNAQLIIWWHWRSTEGGANIAQDAKRIVLTSTPTRISYTFPQYTNQTYNINRINIMMGSYKTDNEIYFTDVKFEQGTQATPWIPHINDTEYSALGYDDTTVYDCSGYQNNGTTLGTALTSSTFSSKYNCATHFGANDSKIYISNFPTSGFGDSYTFSWWAKTSSVTPMHWGFENGIRLNGMYTGTLWNTGDGSQNPLYIPGTTTQVSAPTVNKWHHWVMTGDGTTCKVYQDGQFWAQAKTYKSISGSAIYLNGWAASTAYSSNNMDISDFRIYCTTLSADAVKQLYQVRATGDRDANYFTSGKYIEEDNVSKVQHNGNSDYNEFKEKNYDIKSVQKSNIINITDGADNAPMESVVAHIEPVQSGTGDPSPTNVRPISGWTQAKVARTGKNLCSSPIGRYNWAGGVRYINATGAYCATEDKVSIVGGQTYIVTLKNTVTTQSIYFAWWAGDTYIRSDSLYGEPWSVVAPDNADKLALSFRNNDNYTGSPTVSEVQIEPDSATDYEPYQGDTYTIDLDGTIYDGTVDLVSGKLVVDRVLETLDGSQPVSDNGTQAYGGIQIKYIPSQEKKYASDQQHQNEGIISDKFDSSEAMPSTAYKVTGRSTSGNIFFNMPPDITTAQEARTWFGNNPTQISYLLATPIEYDLTPQEITSLLGVNNVWSDTGDIEITYSMNSNKIQINREKTIFSNSFYES